MLGELNALLDKVCGAEADAYADSESIIELHRCLARLEAATTRYTASFQAGGEWEADGARSVSAWLARRCQVPKGAATRRVQLGRDLRHLPVAEEAWLAGDIGVAQVSALARARTPVTEEAMARDEELLVGHARTLRFDQFVRALRYWSNQADPDGVEDAAAKQRDARRLHLSRSLDGTWFGDLLLDPISGTIVDVQLSRIYDELLAADWAEGRSRLGQDARVADLARTPQQRRADALVEMAIRAGTAPADGRRPEPLFTTLVGYETFAGPICELADGTVVSPGTLAGWLDKAWIERVVFDSPSRVIDVGVTTRLFTGALRRAIEVRDRECFDPYCDVPSYGCQVDHIEPWASGGRTMESNGRMACGYHNRRRHQGPEPPLRT